MHIWRSLLHTRFWDKLMLFTTAWGSKQAHIISSWEEGGGGGGGGGEVK